MNYYTSKTIKSDFNNAIAQTQDALKNEGFGVLSEIDIKDKMKEKLNVDFRNYTILGACNPPLAYEALQIENKIGTLLPCNVIVQEVEPGIIEIAAIDPFESMKIVDNKQLSEVAKKVKSKLDSAVQSLT